MPTSITQDLNKHTSWRTYQKPITSNKISSKLKKVFTQKFSTNFQIKWNNRRKLICLRIINVNKKEEKNAKRKERDEGDRKKRLSEREGEKERERKYWKFHEVPTGVYNSPWKLRYAPTFRQVTKTLMPESKIKRTNTDTEIKVQS